MAIGCRWYDYGFMAGIVGLCRGESGMIYWGKDFVGLDFGFIMAQYEHLPIYKD